MNLGHTFGHVLESHYQIPHGVAVSQGLRFSLEWSRHISVLSENRFKELNSALDRLSGSEKELLSKEKLRTFKPQLTSQRLEKMVKQDKKSVGGESLNFVFLEDLGQPLRKKVSIRDLVQEAERQGWVE